MSAVPCTHHPGTFSRDACIPAAHQPHHCRTTADRRQPAAGAASAGSTQVPRRSVCLLLGRHLHHLHPLHLWPSGAAGSAPHSAGSLHLSSTLWHPHRPPQRLSLGGQWCGGGSGVSAAAAGFPGGAGYQGALVGAAGSQVRRGCGRRQQEGHVAQQRGVRGGRGGGGRWWWCWWWGACGVQPGRGGPCCGGTVHACQLCLEAGELAGGMHQRAVVPATLSGAESKVPGIAAWTRGFSYHNSLSGAIVALCQSQACCLPCREAYPGAL